MTIGFLAFIFVPFLDGMGMGSEVNLLTVSLFAKEAYSFFKVKVLSQICYPKNAVGFCYKAKY